MELITLGRTGLRINRRGFGGIPIQRVDEAQAVKTVQHAVEQGVDFIDTSRAYTTSEGRIGDALKLSAKKVTPATKSVGRKSEEPQADLENSLSDLLQRIASSPPPIRMKSKASGNDMKGFFVDAAITASPALKKFPSL